MAKPKTQYVCQSCGSVAPRWAGKCEGCGAWNTLVEETSAAAAPKGQSRRGGRSLEFVDLHARDKPLLRQMTGISEFDRVCGGGLVPGSVLLLGGDPGIGKSTLLLQVLAALAQKQQVYYISGEESVNQIQLRAERLGVASANVDLAAATHMRDILSTLESCGPEHVVVIDSIQTMYVDTLESAPGTVGQVRACAAELVRLAKQRGFTVFLIGHVTKEGMLAGPRVLEHMVDTVLYFEGDRGHAFRILRTVKNRYGPTDEIGVFEMTMEGLQEVENPSALFLANRQQDISGAAVFAGIEGTRPVLVEIQALLAPSPLATPRRTVVGWDLNRLAMVLAVLETRCGVQMSNNEVYLNVAGGLRISEPAADLAVAAALLSSRYDAIIPADLIILGEIGLSGEIRPAPQTQIRLKEAAKLGFKQAWLPPLKNQKTPLDLQGLSIKQINHLSELPAVLKG